MSFSLDDLCTGFGDETENVFSSQSYKDFVKEDRFSVYDRSSNEKFRSASPATKSKEATHCTADIIVKYTGRNIFVECENRQRYIIVPLKHNDFTIIVKSSCLWGNVPGTFHFQNIRRDRECDVMVFFMVYPDEFKMFWAHRCDVLNDFMMTRQHKGADSWFEVVDTNLPDYFHPMDQINKLWD